MSALVEFITLKTEWNKARYNNSFILRIEEQIIEKWRSVYYSSCDNGAERTELYKTVQEKATSEALFKLQPEAGLDNQDVAKAVVYAIETPTHLSKSEVILRPTIQMIQFGIFTFIQN